MGAAVFEPSEHLAVTVELLIDQPAAMGQRGVLGVLRSDRKAIFIGSDRRRLVCPWGSVIRQPAANGSGDPGWVMTLAVMVWSRYSQ